MRAVLLLFLLLGATPLHAVAVEPPKQGDNLLQNPGFEDGFYYWNKINELHVGNGWTPWWVDNPEHDPTYYRPEYKQAKAEAFPNRVHSGANAQQWFKLYSSFYAGIYQQVDGVTVDENYRFSLWGQVWSSTEDNPPDQSTAPANPHLQIGIDPYGNIDPFSANILWSQEANFEQVIDGWVQLAVDTVARNSTITVFVRSRPEFANKHNNVYLDDAALQAVVPPSPTPPSPSPTTTVQAIATLPPVTETVPAATATLPPPTATTASTSPPPPAPTETVAATEPVATNTPMAEPSATATPTQMIVSSPTATPSLTVVPTETGTATATGTVTATTAMTSTPTATTTVEQPTATVGTEVAEVPPTAVREIEPTPQADGAGDEGVSPLLCAAPFLGVGVLGLILVMVRRRQLR